MSKKEDKIKLEQEVNELADRVYNYTGYRNNFDDLRKEYSTLESSYKKHKKERQKINRVRNLKVTRYGSIVLLPFVVCGGVFIGTMSECLSEYKKGVEVGNEKKIISMDSTGSYEEKLGTDGYNDSIVIKTRWFEENGNLVRYTYEAQEDVAFHTKEDVEKAVSKDYVALLNEYDFTQTNKDVAEISEERVQNYLGEDNITIKAGVRINEEEKNKINDSISIGAGEIGGSFFASLLVTGITALVSLGACAVFKYDKWIDRVKRAKRIARYDLSEIPNTKEEKKKLKELKKKLK